MRHAWGVCLLLAACAHARWERVELAHTPGPAEYPRAHRVVLLDELNIDFKPEGGKVVGYEHSRYRVKILTPEAERPDAAHAWYNRTYSELLALHARVVHLDGSTEEADESKTSELPAMQSFELYSDSRVVVLPTATPSVGEVWEYETLRKELDPKLLGFSTRLEGNDPILLERVVITVPKGWEVERGFRFGAPRKFEEQEQPDGTMRYTLELKDVPAHRNEPMAGPSVASVLVRLKLWTQEGQTVTAWASPKEMSKGVWELMRASEGSNAEIDAEAERIKREVGEDPEARARAAHQWVCEKIQYCAIEIGLGGWVPHPAADVQRLGYGDCKDKAMLLHVLLQKLGIASEPTLIYSHQGLPLPFGLPILSDNFNHAILKVDLPGRSLLTDPTAEYVPFGELPRGDLEADVLPLSADGAPLERSPLHGGPVDELSSVLTLHPGAGGLEGTVALKLAGTPGNEWRSRLAREASSKHAKEWCRLFGDGCALSRLEAKGLQKGARSLEVSGEVVLERAVERSGSWWTLRAHRLGDWGYDAPHLSLRTQPVLLRAAGRWVQTVNVQLSPSEEAVVPPPSRLERDFASYELTWSTSGDQLVMKRVFELKAHVLPKERYAEVVEFDEQLRQAEAKVAVVKPKGAH